jgi:hypothetical protein
MDYVSDLSSGIRLKSQSDTQTRQLWNDINDSGFWENPVTFLAIEELTLAEATEAAHAPGREQSTGGGPPTTNPLRDNGRGDRVPLRP